MTTKLTEIAVIGGGIVGASIAWQLATRNAGKVTLFERATIAAGASGRTGALLRRHYSNEPEARLAQLGNQVFRNWPDIVGGSCGFVPCGVVVTVDTGPGFERNIDLLRQNIAMHNRIGIDSRLIGQDELRELQPFASVEDIQYAAYEPDSGYVDSIEATLSMASASQRAGASIREGVAVHSLSVSGGRIEGLNTSEGNVSADVAVCAAGPWSTRLFESVGITLPIHAIRVQIIIALRPLSMNEPHMIFLDTVQGLFTRPWGPGRSLIGLAGGDQHDEVDPDQFEVRNDPDYPARALAAAGNRFPGMKGATYLHGHAGLYDMTPDTHPILGETGIDGLFLAAGFSGAGFKTGPVVGQCLAELVLDGGATIADLTPFALSRFESATWRRPWSQTEYDFKSDFGHGL